MLTLFNSLSASTATVAQEHFKTFNSLNWLEFCKTDIETVSTAIICFNSSRKLINQMVDFWVQRTSYYVNAALENFSCWENSWTIWDKSQAAQKGGEGRISQQTCCQQTFVDYWNQLSVYDLDITITILIIFTLIVQYQVKFRYHSIYRFWHQTMTITDESCFSWTMWMHFTSRSVCYDDSPSGHCEQWQLQTFSEIYD